MVQSTALRAGIGVAGSKPTEPPIDMVHLGRQTFDDDGLALEVLRLFDSSISAQYDRLETSTTIADLLKHLHGIKGAASGIGAWALSSLARRAEAELMAGEPVNPERIDEIGIAVEEVRGYIADLVASQPE